MTASDRDPNATEQAFAQDQERDILAEEDSRAGPGEPDSAEYEYDRELPDPRPTWWPCR
jgi:hypothetical protein